jgi:hypothetical protein
VQFDQCVLPPGLVEFGAQAVHAPSASDGPYVPGGQSSQSLPTPLNFPAAHTTHAEPGAPSSMAVTRPSYPAPHVQFSELLRGAAECAGHAAHAASPCSGAKLPAMHGIQYAPFPAEPARGLGGQRMRPPGVPRGGGVGTRGAAG